MISHTERIKACMAGQQTDHVPVAFWRHFPVDDQDPQSLAAAVAAFQNTNDFDLIKITPASSFCLKDWGAEDRWVGNPEGTREHINQVIQAPDGWTHMRVLNPAQGALSEQISCLNLLVREFSPTTPILQTIFNPLSQAKNLVGRENLMVHMRLYPEALHAGLERITVSSIRFIETAIKTGIDGIFFAVQHAQYSLLSEKEYDEFGRYYDLRILEAAKKLWCNMLHLHGEDVMFDSFLDYPCQIINWHDRPGPPSLPEGHAKSKKTVCGGLKQIDTMLLGNPASIRVEAQDAIQSMRGKPFILGTGCVIPITVPQGNIRAAVQAVRGSDQE